MHCTCVVRALYVLCTRIFDMCHPSCILLCKDGGSAYSGFVTLSLLSNSSTQPYSLMSWVRAIVSNRMAGSGEQWVNTMKQYNSGTYNNQVLSTKNHITSKRLKITQPIPSRYSMPVPRPSFHSLTLLLSSGLWWI